MKSKDITPTALGKIIAAEAIKSRSYLKEIFDGVESYELLNQGIIKGLGFIGQVEQDGAAKKLTNYVRHYFGLTKYDYLENDIYQLKKTTEHTIEVLTKWAKKIDMEVKAKKPIRGFNRYIHRSVSALATRLNKIEDLRVRKAHFQISSYKINYAFFKYGYITQDTIKQALGKISAELGVTDAMINVGEGTTFMLQATGISIKVEIKHTQQIISNIYNHFDQKNKKLDSVYTAQLKRVVNSLKTRISGIEKLTTRYHYMSLARVALNKYVTSFDEDFAAIVQHNLVLLKDEQATQYKNNQYKTKVSLRNKTNDNYKLTLMSSLKSSKDILENETIYVEVLKNGYISYKLRTPSHVVKEGVITEEDFKETVIIPKRNKLEDFNAIKEQIIQVIAERGKTYKKSNTHWKLNIKDAEIIFDEVESTMIKQMQPSRYQSWAKLCLSICLLTGRRIYEVCVTGNFEIINSHTMKMNGVAKQKNEEDKENKYVEFRTFANSHLIIQAIKTLCEIKDFSVYGDDYMKFNKSAGTPLRSALSPQRKNQIAMISSPAVMIKLLPKSMRQLYAAMLKYKIKKQKPNESDNCYDSELAKHLGHDFERDIQTVQSYKDIVIHD